MSSSPPNPAPSHLHRSFPPDSASPAGAGSVTGRVMAGCAISVTVTGMVSSAGPAMLAGKVLPAAGSICTIGD